MKSTHHATSPVALALAALALTLLPLVGSAQRHVFSESEVFFELNDTDGDLGIHALIDGDAWKNLVVTDPLQQKVLNVWIRNRLRRQGLTEFFFESAEPPFDELEPSVFFERFPAGQYLLEARAVDGFVFEGDTELTHVIPAPPQPTVNGQAMATECDDEDPAYAPTEVMAPVTIAWPAVTMSHPDADGPGAGVQPPVAVTIQNYELVVEVESENPEPSGEPYDSVFSVKLPGWETSFTIPAEFIGLGDTFKYEVLAREESFNQTAIESCFVLVGP